MMLVSMCIALAACGAQPVQQQPERSAKMDIAPARDPEIAVREEYDIAVRSGTVEAYDLFIARHPKHRLAEAAKQERAALDAKC
jgi:hypothetical protein